MTEPQPRQRQKEGSPWVLSPTTFHLPQQGLVKVGSAQRRVTQVTGAGAGGRDLI